MSSPDLFRLNQDAIVALFVLDLNPIGHDVLYRFCNEARSSANPVSFAGRLYPPMPVEATGFELTGKQIPTPQLRIGNAASAVSLILLQYGDLVGAKVTRILTFAKHLDGGTEPNGAMELDKTIWFVDRKVSESKLEIVFELASSLDLMNVRLPHRLVVPNLCLFDYRSPECGYAGNLPTCDKTLKACEDHFGKNKPLSFGGFPGAGNNRVG